MRRLVLAALAATVLFPAVAAAQSAGDLRAERISVSDINLNSPAGEALAQRRIRDAARRVCSADSQALRFAQAERACRRAAEADAMTRMQSLMVAARTDASPTVSAGLR